MQATLQREQVHTYRWGIVKSMTYYRLSLHQAYTWGTRGSGGSTGSSVTRCGPLTWRREIKDTLEEAALPASYLPAAYPLIPPTPCIPSPTQTDTRTGRGCFFAPAAGVFVLCDLFYSSFLLPFFNFPLFFSFSTISSFFLFFYFFFFHLFDFIEWLLF